MKRMVNYSPSMSDRKVARLAKKGRLETRTADEIARDAGRGRKLTTDHVLGVRVWLGREACKKAGVTYRTTDTTIDANSAAADIEKFEAAGYRVDRDDKVGTVDIVDKASGKRVSQYTNVYGTP